MLDLIISAPVIITLAAFYSGIDIQRTIQTPHHNRFNEKILIKFFAHTTVVFAVIGLTLCSVLDPQVHSTKPLTVIGYAFFISYCILCGCITYYMINGRNHPHSFRYLRNSILYTLAIISISYITKSFYQ